MMNAGFPPPKSEILDAWLTAVSSHLAVRRRDFGRVDKKKRNRERERARREARLLFAEYHQDLALSGVASFGGIERRSAA